MPPPFVAMSVLSLTPIDYANIWSIYANIWSIELTFGVFELTSGA